MVGTIDADYAFGLVLVAGLLGAGMSVNCLRSFIKKCNDTDEIPKLIAMRMDCMSDPEEIAFWANQLGHRIAEHSSQSSEELAKKILSAGNAKDLLDTIPKGI